MNEHPPTGIADPQGAGQPVGREAVRDALMDATIELLAERSAAAISVRDIAARAHVQHSLVFRHFGDKDTLLRDSMARYFTAMEQQVATFRDLDDAIEQLFVMSGSPQSLAMARACLEQIPFPESIGVPAVLRRVEELIAQEQDRQGGLPRFDPRAVAIAMLNYIGSCGIYRELNALTATADGLEPETLHVQLREMLRITMGTIADTTDDDER